VIAKIYKFDFLTLKCLEGLEIKYTIGDRIILKLPLANRVISVEYLHRDLSTSDEYFNSTLKCDLHQGPIELEYMHGKKPTVTKLMPDQQPITKVPIQMPTTDPDSKMKKTHLLDSHHHHKSKNNAEDQKRYEESKNSTISTSPEQEYPKKIYDLLLVTRIYNIATERLATESTFLKELYNLLLRARSSMISKKPTCSIWVKELKIGINPDLYTITKINNEMDSLQQLMDQKTSFGTKLQNENYRVKKVVHDYCEFGKDENLLKSGYLATIETIESTSQGIQKVWCSYLQSPVVSKYILETESQRCKLFAEYFAAIFDMVIFLNEDCSSPNPWSFHTTMIKLMEKFQSFSTVGVCN
jgi:hypothetical protein